MFEQIKDKLLFGLPSSSNQQVIRTRILEDNRKFTMIWALAQVFYWGYCLFMSYRSEAFTLCRGAYLSGITLSILSWICANYPARKVPRLTVLAAALSDLALFSTSLWIARILLRHDIWTLMIFAAVLLVPTMYICDTVSNGVLALLNLLAAALLLKRGVDPETYRWTISNLAIFSSIGVLMGHFVNKARFERYLYAESAMQLAESNAKLAEVQTRYAYYDQLTGLLNRRAYSEKISELAGDPPDGCCIVMIDLNGLKEVNDLCGHDAGDEVLIAAANHLLTSFRGIDLIYRLGGDEFSVILTDTQTDPDLCLARLESACAAWKGERSSGISISYGHASTKDYPDLASIQRTADQRMYAFKANYYRTTGKDRRQQYLSDLPQGLAGNGMEVSEDPDPVVHAAGAPRS